MSAFARDESRRIRSRSRERQESREKRSYEKIRGEYSQSRCWWNCEA